MKASTHTFHSAFRVQSVRVWPLSLWSSPQSTPVLCRSSYEVAQTFLTSGHTRAKSSPNIYGFCPQATPRGVWVMGYCGCMGYAVFFPANQLGGVKNLWDLWEYVVCEPWVTTYERVQCPQYEKSKQECGPPDRRMHQAFPIEVSWKLVRLFPPFNSTHLASSAIQRRPEKPCPILPAYAHTGSRDRSSSPGDDFIHPLPLSPQQTVTGAFLA